MQSMHEGMMMMGEMHESRQNMMSRGATQQHEMDCAANDAQCQRIQLLQNRQQAMQERMKMMQHLPEQVEQ